MRMRRVAVVIGLVGATLLSGGEKKPQKSTPHSGENDVLEITATAIADPESVKEVLGSDLGGHYILMDVRLVPKEGRKLAVRLDDFVLKTDKDGEKTGPFVPSQIAGKGSIVVTQEGGGRGGFGVGPMSMGTADISQAHTTVKSGANEKPNPILDVLKEKILPEKETEAPVSGLLYFPMEKQKLKDLELIYTTTDGKLRLRFK
ncbi:MAG TPA: hypothetical protein VK335_17135 [Bryobacteraceae bacterium]|nr:hypothetical protein [Bryobacteraceae bacterium]